MFHILKFLHLMNQEMKWFLFFVNKDSFIHFNWEFGAFYIIFLYNYKVIIDLL